MITFSVESGAASGTPKITPFSQIINLLIFAVFALFTRYYTTVALQSLLIIYSLLLCRVSFSEFHLKELIPLLPILGFVLILNCFRGSGEILLKVGPFVLVRQGVLRGIYYFIVIAQLWLISKVLTKGFGEDSLLSTLYTMDSVLTKSGNRKKLFVILYYILRIFHNTYAEIKLLLKRRNRDATKEFGEHHTEYSPNSLKQRILQFIYTSFERSKRDFESSSRISVKKQYPVAFDYLYITLEMCCIVLAFTFRNRLIMV